MFAVAQSIATTGVFGNPNGVPSGPTAHVPPVHPYILAAVLTTTSSTAFPYVLTALNIVAASLIWALLPAIAVRLGLERRIALAAGLIGAFSPLRHWIELNGSWETTLAGLSSMVMVGLTMGRRPSDMTPWYSAGLGVGWGFVVLLQPATAMVFVVCSVWMASRAAHASRGLAITIAACVLTLAPWTIRNYRTFGGFIFVRGNLGMELSVSNNDGALADKENLARNPRARHPHVDRGEFAKRIEMGELAYDRGRLRDAVEWISANPGRFLSLTAERVKLFWIPARDHLWLAVLEAAIAILALIGLLYLPQPAFGVVLGIWLTYPLMYYVVQADERFRFPIEWTITLSAAAAVVRPFSSTGRITSDTCAR